MNGCVFTQEQVAELVRLKAYFPFRIVWGCIDCQTETFSAHATHTRHLLNKRARDVRYLVATAERLLGRQRTYYIHTDKPVNIYASRGVGMTYGEMEQLMQGIIRACNTHSALLAACEKHLRAWEDGTNLFPWLELKAAIYESKGGHEPR